MMCNKDKKQKYLQRMMASKSANLLGYELECLTEMLSVYLLVSSSWA